MRVGSGTTMPLKSTTKNVKKKRESLFIAIKINLHHPEMKNFKIATPTVHKINRRFRDFFVGERKY